MRTLSHLAAPVVACFVACRGGSAPPLPLPVKSSCEKLLGNSFRSTLQQPGVMTDTGPGLSQDLLLFPDSGSSFRLISSDTFSIGTYSCDDGRITATLDGLREQISGSIDDTGSRLVWGGADFELIHLPKQEKK